MGGPEGVRRSPMRRGQWKKSFERRHGVLARGAAPDPPDPTDATNRPNRHPRPDPTDTPTRLARRRASAPRAGDSRRPDGDAGDGVIGGGCAGSSGHGAKFECDFSRPMRRPVRRWRGGRAASRGDAVGPRSDARGRRARPARWSREFKRGRERFSSAWRSEVAGHVDGGRVHEPDESAFTRRAIGADGRWCAAPRCGRPWCAPSA